MINYKNSHTRGVPLSNLAGLCLILGNSSSSLTVKALASLAIEAGIIESKSIISGQRFPTRINHHIIALRQLDLVSYRPRGSHVDYSLNEKGIQIYNEAKEAYSGEGPIDLNAKQRAVWRPILVASDYVRLNWLKYFMPHDDFTYEDLIAKGDHVTFYRAGLNDREEPMSPKNPDSGYRIISAYWEPQVLFELDRRELLHGLRRWTNEVYLTDDQVPMDLAVPFSYLNNETSDSHIIETECYVVKAWLDPDKDLPYFIQLVNQTLDERRQGSRITIPDLIIDLCSKYGYSKDNIKEMLVRLFYEHSNVFFFERGSKFLVEDAFKLSNKDKPSVYYIKIEGAWRTSLVRYEAAQRLRT